MTRQVLAVVATVVWVVTTAACALAIRLELDGFGRERDTDPRPGYLAALALVVLAGGVASVLVWRWAGVRSWLVPAGVAVAAAVTVFLISGVST